MRRSVNKVCKYGALIGCIVMEICVTRMCWSDVLIDRVLGVGYDLFSTNF